MKRFVLSVTSILLYVFSIAQIGGNAVYNRNENYQYQNTSNGVDLNLAPQSYSFSNSLEANVMVNVKASAYVAIFSVTQHANTIEEAEQMLTTRIASFKKQVEQNTSVTKVFVDPVSLVPTYETEVINKKYSKTFNEVPTGFEIKKNVHITFVDHDLINTIIAYAARSEIYDLVKADYVVDDLEAVLDKIRQDALRILLVKKATIEKAGVHTRLRQVGEKYGSSYPFERYTQYYAYKTGMSPAFVNVYKKGTPVQQVQYNYAEKNKTVYYDKVSDRQFDKVLNPVVGEPMVQVYLSLKAQFDIVDPEAEATTKEYDRQMRLLQLKEMELKVEEKKKDIELKGKK